MSHIVVQLPNNEWAVCSICTTHPTKGAADKAANKMKTTESGSKKNWKLCSKEFALKHPKDSQFRFVEHFSHGCVESDWAFIGDVKSFTARHPNYYVFQTTASEDEEQTKPEVLEPDYMEIRWGGMTFALNFFSNKNGTCVALCASPGYENFFGKSTSWWGAAQDCMNKIMQSEVV
jgi:hypothetical protein